MQIVAIFRHFVSSTTMLRTHAAGRVVQLLNNLHPCLVYGLCVDIEDFPHWWTLIGSSVPMELFHQLRSECPEMRRILFSKAPTWMNKIRALNNKALQQHCTFKRCCTIIQKTDKSLQPIWVLIWGKKILQPLSYSLLSIWTWLALHKSGWKIFQGHPNS